MQQSFSLNTQVMIEAIEAQEMFQALTQKTFIKIDFHVGEEVPGLAVNVPTIEDAIASKLYWIKLGSQKSRADVIGMMNSEHVVNYDQLTSICEQMDVKQLLDELMTEAENE